VSRMAAAPNVIRLRHPATCGTCSRSLLTGTFAVWDPVAKKPTCETCVGDGHVVAGVSGLDIDGAERASS
jgi:hypothetical protein